MFFISVSIMMEIYYLLIVHNVHDEKLGYADFWLERLKENRQSAN